MTLHEIGLKHGTDKATHHQFLDFYEQHIGHLRDEPVKLLEIGFFKGESIKMWLEYFPNAEVHCIDVDDYLLSFSDPRFSGYQISQENPAIQKLFENNYFDIIVDDGSHMTHHQMISLDYLWKKVKSGGFYIMEDLHTSFMQGYIMSNPTTYEFLIEGKFVSQYEPMRREFKEVLFFQRDPNTFQESLTSIIKKV